MYNENFDKELFQEKFNGFYRGVVVDTDDPKKNGRAKIRIYPMFSDVNIDDLPWAIYADTGFGGMQDVGQIKVPEVDSHVFVFFENGDHRYPVYFAGAPAIQNGVPDSPKLSREDDGTVANINSKIKTNVPIAGGGVWNEPQSAYAAKYPNNKVIKSKSGIVVEIDDTEGAVRFHIYHPSGTREEISNSGDKVEHTEGKKTTVTVGDNNIKVDGSMNVNISSNGTVKITGNANVEVGGDAEINVTGDTDINTTIANVIADQVNIESEDVKLDSNGVLGGIVTQNHVCAFTGNPHPQGSLTCKAGG